MNAFSGNTSLRRGPSVAAVSHCGLVVRGVPVEWIEATVASTGQATLIYFASGGSPGSLVAARPRLDNLATATGARVFSVGTRLASVDFRSAVEDGVAVYAWLLEEGVDLANTAFIGDDADGRLSTAVLSTVRERGLAVPARGSAEAWPADSTVIGRVAVCDIDAESALPPRP